MSYENQLKEAIKRDRAIDKRIHSLNQEIESLEEQIKNKKDELRSFNCNGMVLKESYQLFDKWMNEIQKEMDK